MPYKVYIYIYTCMQVPLGVHFKNEAYLVDMPHIMAKYVPVEKTVTTITVDGNGPTYNSSQLYQLLFFED